MTRIRDHSTITPVSSLQTVKRANGSLLSSGTVVGSVYSLAIMNDEPTPRYKMRSQQGHIFNKPMSKLVTTGLLKTSYFLCQHKTGSYAGYRTEYSADGVSLESHPAVRYDRTDLKQKREDLALLALTDAYAEAGKADVEGLTVLAEMRETIDFLCNPVASMVRFTKRARKWLATAERREQRYRAAKKTWEGLPSYIRRRRREPVAPVNKPFRVGDFAATDISSFWLAYRYGLMPLIYTFQDIHKKLTDTSGVPFRATSRGKASYDDVEQTSSSRTTPFLGDTWDQLLDYQITARAGVLYETRATVSSSRDWGLTLDRLPAAMYEKIPLSFVADWFWNGASYYDALTVDIRVQRVLAAWTTVRMSWLHQSIFTRVNGSTTAITVTCDPSSYHESGTLTERKVRSLSDVKVGLRVDLNAKRVVDGFALIHTFLGRKK